MPQAIIMAGGQGERFWPLTHKKYPKYCLCFSARSRGGPTSSAGGGPASGGGGGGKRGVSLLNATYSRLLSVYKRKEIHVVTTSEHSSVVRKELPGLLKENLVLEPQRKNTAAAIFLCCAMIRERFGPEEVVSFFPADHLIRDVSSFKKTIRGAVQLAKQTQALVTVGIRPTFPATGYGYIRAGKPLRKGSKAYRVDRFVEKPDYKTAVGYLKQKKFLWNGGIFSWQSGVFLDAMKRHSPGYYRRFVLNDIPGSYRRLPNLSIDCALLEKTHNLLVVTASMDWCDLGSWDMYLERSQIDSQGNFQLGKSMVSKEVRGSLLVSENSKKPLVVLGVSNLIVVQTKHGTLICPRGRSEEAALLSRKITPS